jgi:hypothetical protein
MSLMPGLVTSALKLRTPHPQRGREKVLSVIISVGPLISHLSLGPYGPSLKRGVMVKFGMARKRNRSLTVQVVFCLLSLVMLVTLPIQRAHQFRIHYRTTQVRRTFERHSEFAESAQQGLDSVGEEATRAVPFSLPLIAEPDPDTVVVTQSTATTALLDIPRLLSRLKLGPPSDGQDPFLLV